MLYNHSMGIVKKFKFSSRVLGISLKIWTTFCHLTLEWHLLYHSTSGKMLNLTSCCSTFFGLNAVAYGNRTSPAMLGWMTYRPLCTHEHAVHFSLLMVSWKSANLLQESEGLVVSPSVCYQWWKDGCMWPENTVVISQNSFGENVQTRWEAFRERWPYPEEHFLKGSSGMLFLLLLTGFLIPHGKTD